MGLPASLWHLSRSCHCRETGCGSKVLHARPRLLREAAHRSKFGRQSGWSVCAASRRPDQDPADERAQPQQIITFLSADGIVQFPIGDSSRSALFARRALRPVTAPLPTPDEQRLCIGATFMVAATNGHDPSRRIHLLGYCRSVDMLSEVVEDSVLSSGGEVVRRERELRASLHESLRMTVAIPWLFGVPPAYEMLSNAIRLGGGIVDRVSRQWQMY